MATLILHAGDNLKDILVWDEMKFEDGVALSCIDVIIQEKSGKERKILKSPFKDLENV